MAELAELIDLEWQPSLHDVVLTSNQSDFETVSGLTAIEQALVIALRSNANVQALIGCHAEDVIGYLNALEAELQPTQRYLDRGSYQIRYDWLTRKLKLSATTRTPERESISVALDLNS